MARVARRAERRVLIIDVAGGTGYRRVFTGERKLGGGVIECRARPIRCRVAQRTILRETGGSVVGA